MAKNVPQMANEWVEKSVNESFELYGIPARISLVKTGETRSTWAVNFLDGADEDAIIARIHEEQDKILRKDPRDPRISATKEDALFMVVSQLFEWIMKGGGSVSHPNYPTLMLMMDLWMDVYKAKGGKA